MFRLDKLFPSRPPPSADTFNNFSLPQWATIIVLDVAPKAAIVWLQPVFVFFLFFHPFLFFYLLLLIPVTCLISFFRLRAIWALLVIIFFTSSLSIGAATFLKVQEHAAQMRDFCFHTPGGAGCEEWVNGAPWSHVLKRAADELPIFTINVIPFLAVFIYSRWRARRKLSQRAA